MPARSEQIDYVSTELLPRAALLTRLLVRQLGGELSRTEVGLLKTLGGGSRRITELAELEGLAQPTITILIKQLGRARAGDADTPVRRRTRRPRRLDRERERRARGVPRQGSALSSARTLPRSQTSRSRRSPPPPKALAQLVDVLQQAPAATR